MKKSLIIGPFADNKEAIEKFGTNVYISHLYSETIQELFEAEKELDVAKKLEAAESEIALLEERVKFLESVVSLANRNFHNYETDDDSPEMNQ